MREQTSNSRRLPENDFQPLTLIRMGSIVFPLLIINLAIWFYVVSENASHQTDEIQKLSSNYSTEDLVCGIITTSKYHRTRAKAVNDTWGKRCGVTVFFSATPDSSLPLVALEGSEEGTIINEKVFRMFKYMWETYPDKKWFIKADDDTYLHLENLVSFLGSFDWREPIYVGRAGEWGSGPELVRYCGGGAGYILSRKALQMWYPYIDRCQRLSVGEDVSIGKCLRDKVSIEPIWRTGFYHRPPEFFLTNPQGKMDHPEGLSPRPISFHSVSPERMYELEYLCHYVLQPLTANGKWANPHPPSMATH